MNLASSCVSLAMAQVRLARFWDSNSSIRPVASATMVLQNALE